MSSETLEKSLQAKQYLEKTVVPVLTQALTQMCVAEPEDPFTWLAQVRPAVLLCSAIFDNCPRPSIPSFHRDPSLIVSFLGRCIGFFFDTSM
jgi:hypothetical protein